MAGANFLAQYWARFKVRLMEFSTEGNRFHSKFLAPADLVTQAEITFWSLTYRVFGTGCYRDLRLNPNAIGFASMHELLERIKEGFGSEVVRESHEDPIPSSLLRVEHVSVGWALHHERWYDGEQFLFREMRVLSSASHGLALLYPM